MANETTKSRPHAFLDAVINGDEEEVARLLVEQPSLILVEDDRRDEARGHTALFHAAQHGHDKIMARLLAVASPELVVKASGFGLTALSAVCPKNEERYHSIARQLLAANPSAINASDNFGFNLLHRACVHKNDVLIEMFLDIKPELAHQKAFKIGMLPLHSASTLQDRRMIRRLIEVNPDALRAVTNPFGKTPLDEALVIQNDIFVEALQWSLTFDEITTSFKKAKKSAEHFKPLFEAQCEVLLELLNKDLADIVFQFLGTRQQVQPTTPSASSSSPVFLPPPRRT